MMEKTFREELERGLKEESLSITRKQLEKYEQYAEMVVFWNKKVNLTAIIDPIEMAMKHFIDSLICLKYFGISGNEKIIDVGTGAGFPGLIWKIYYPKTKITLLDALEKRCRFLNQVIKEINIRDVAVVHGRAEEKGQDPAFREKYHVAAARAVTRLVILSEYCLPFVKRKGVFLALKGSHVEEEVFAAQRAIQLLGGHVSSIKEFSLPILGDGRSLVVVEKLGKTPHQYPRRPGIPEKRPIL